MRDPLLKRLGERVRAVREARGLSQEKLSDLAGIHRTYLSSLERGNRNATVLTLAKVAGALGLKVTALLVDATHTKKGAK